MRMRRIVALTALLLALVSVGIASAVTSLPWTPSAIKALIRSAGYPKPHPKKLACKRTPGGYYKCTATYRRAKKQMFYVVDKGAWLCVGHRKAASCQLLGGVGFIPRSEAADMPHLEASIRFASEAYIQIRFHVQYPTTYGGCTYSATPLNESCTYAKPDVTVTITAKPAKGGYLIHGST